MEENKGKVIVISKSLEKRTAEYQKLSSNNILFFTHFPLKLSYKLIQVLCEENVTDPTNDKVYPVVIALELKNYKKT